jgi:putative hemolysin
MARLAELLGIEAPEGDYVTVAGFLLDELGRIPEVGDAVSSRGHRFEVAEMRGARISRVLVVSDLDHDAVDEVTP